LCLGCIYYKTNLKESSLYYADFYPSLIFREPFHQFRLVHVLSNYRRLSLSDSQLLELGALLPDNQDANHQSGQSPQSTDRRLTTQFVSALTGIWSLIGELESSYTNGTSSRYDPVSSSGDRQWYILTPFYAATSVDTYWHPSMQQPQVVWYGKKHQDQFMKILY
jgi:hypothetical protein